MLFYMMKINETLSLTTPPSLPLYRQLLPSNIGKKGEEQYSEL